MTICRSGATRRTALLGIAALGAVPADALGEDNHDLARATALLMIEDRGYPYCARFDAEVKDGYVRSAEGQRAPLVRRLRRSPDVAFLAGIAYSPTFVLLVEGREAGRHVGYPGADLFWMQLAGLLGQAGLSPAGG